MYKARDVDQHAEVVEKTVHVHSKVLLVQVFVTIASVNDKIKVFVAVSMIGSLIFSFSVSIHL